MNTITNIFPPYSPLDSSLKEIRVLIVQAGPKSAKICCSLAHTSLTAEAHTKYEAVSYCWGDTKDQKVIILEGCDFRVTRSAEGALRAFRQENEDRALWLDAICINQQDTDERGSQVSIMKDIYKSATRALVWLGEDDGTFSLAVELMGTLVRQMMDQTGGWEGVDAKARWEVLKDFSWDSKEHLADIRTHNITSYDSPAWDALERLFNRPWFTRMWVIQEIVLSRSPIAFCGYEEVEWVMIQMAASWITRQRYDARSQKHGLSQAKNIAMVWNFAAKNSLGSLLLLTRDFQATDPRDKVFGLLGLATDCGNGIPVALLPNYHKSIPHIYSDAIRYMIQASQSLDVLSHIGYVAPFEAPTDSSKRLFPSWIPRWEKGTPRTQNNYFNTTAWGRVAQPYSAAGGSIIAIDATHNDPNSLILQGMRIDKIKWVSSIITYRELGTTAFVSSVWNEYVSKLEEYPTGEELLRVFSLTMVADATLNKQLASLNPQHDLDFATYILTHGGENLKNVSKKEQGRLVSNSSKGDGVRYGAAATNATEGRSFCTTALGWMGICPPTAREGDLICVLFGGKVLYTIRREDRHSVFLGECYVHGRMDGSGLEDQLLKHAPAESFTLR